MNIKKIVNITALGALLVAGGAAAANGKIAKTGGNSTTSAEVKASVPQMVRVTNFGDGLDEFDLGTFDPSIAVPTDMVATDAFCVYRNNASGTYTIKFEGDGGSAGSGTSFLITDGTNDLAYTVKFGEDATARAAASAFTAGATVGGQTGGSKPDCSVGNMASLEVRVAVTDAEAAVAGDYAGDLTVTVAVE